MPAWLPGRHGAFPVRRRAGRLGLSSLCSAGGLLACMGLAERPAAPLLPSPLYHTLALCTKERLTPRCGPRRPSLPLPPFFLLAPETGPAPRPGLRARTRTLPLLALPLLPLQRMRCAATPCPAGPRLLRPSPCIAASLFTLVPYLWALWALFSAPRCLLSACCPLPSTAAL